jgi:hypothetical protein
MSGGILVFRFRHECRSCRGVLGREIRLQGFVVPPEHPPFDTNSNREGASAELPREIGLRRAFFRSVNEQVAGVNKRHDALGQATLVLFCECGSPNCEERLELTRAEYERVRAQRTHFVLKAGHDNPRIELVAEALDGYVVVERSDPSLENLVESFDSAPCNGRYQS